MGVAFYNLLIIIASIFNIREIHKMELICCRIEAPCPNNYNPADYFVQLLAIAPGKETACRQAVDQICQSFKESDLGVKIELESAPTVNLNVPKLVINEIKFPFC